MKAEQRVKYINLARRIQEHPDFRSKYAENRYVRNREIAFNRIFDEVMAQQRRTELDLYRMLSSDDSFRLAMMDTLKRIMRG